jgi:hypothetical protein
MHLSHLALVVSLLCSIVASYTYLRDTIQGTTKPNRVSWGAWALAPFVACGAAFSAGADLWSLARVFFAGLLPLVVFIASFFCPAAYWKCSLFDFLCGLLSVTAVIVWLFLSDPITAVVMTVVADGVASIPTLIKMWAAPQTETLSSYVAFFFSTFVIVPFIQVWDVPNAAFPLYLLFINIVFIGLLVLRKTSMRRSPIT